MPRSSPTSRIQLLGLETPGRYLHGSWSECGDPKLVAEVGPRLCREAAYESGAERQGGAILIVEIDDHERIQIHRRGCAAHA